MTAFQEEVNSVLHEKGYDKRYYPLMEMSKIVEENEKLVNNKVFFYQWIGMSLLLVIAILGLLIPYLIGLDAEDYTWKETVISVAGLLLAIATILNSMFKPYERFSAACHLGIKISQFKVGVLLALEQQTQVTDDAIFNVVKHAINELEKFQEELIELFLPSQPTNVNNGGHSYASIGENVGKNSAGANTGQQVPV